MADKKKVTKKPSGLSIARDKDDFTFQWKQGEKYESQTLEYSIAKKFKKKKPAWETHTNSKTKKKERKWESKSVSKGATSLKLKNKDNIAAIAFRVKAKAKSKNTCDYVEKEYIIDEPNTPSVSASLKNITTTTFSWSTTVDNKSKKAFEKNISQHKILHNWNETDYKKAGKTGWSERTNQKSSGSVSIEETGWEGFNYSHTRIFRICAKGWAGLVSKWAYAKHIYATPNPAYNVAATRSYYRADAYTVSVTWTSSESSDHPIDTTTVEYTKVVPEVTVTRPSSRDGELTMSMSCPSIGTSWTARPDAGGKKGNCAMSFIDDTGIPHNQCMYVRVINKHDSNEAPNTGGPQLVKGGVSKIEPPGAPVVTPGGIENLYTISCDRNTSIENAAIAVYFRSSSKPDKPICIGVIKPEEDSTDCIIPPFPDGDTISFGLKTFVGNYRPYEPPVGSDTYTLFTPSPVMSSDTVWGEGVPLPPSGLKVEAVNESTVQVSWKWTWTDATQAELSWSDHEDAWQSTDEPSTYIVNNTNAGQWNIAGLGIGTWYIRVRLLKTVGDSITYGAYSPTQTIKLASSPDTPSLVLSSGVISKNDSVTCYWAYVTGDGTGQKQAEICEAFPVYEVVEEPTGDPYENLYYERREISPGNYQYYRSNDHTVDPNKTYYRTTGQTEYGKVLRSTDSAQHITINASDPDLNWQPGETHYLAVRVMSMSDMSGGWSAPVAVSIAEELSIEIVSTNLLYKTIDLDVAEGESPETLTQFSMVAFPLEINIKGLDSGGKVTCIIDRADDYHVERPDGGDLDGFKGETVFMQEYDTSAITINQNDPSFIGILDDTASYSITIILNDTYGQSISTNKIPTGVYEEVEDPEGNPVENGWYVLVNNEYVLSTDTEVVSGVTYYIKDIVDSFFVHWNHQAIKPKATITVDKENLITIIEPELPQGEYSEVENPTGNPMELGYYVYVNDEYILTTDTTPIEGTIYYTKVNDYELGDVIDIYRLSADPPELIYSGAIMTNPPTKYVDPYPTFGEFGGHRIVYRTVNGDYITEENEIAFTDYTADENSEYKQDLFGVVIDFNGEQLILPYNVSLSNSWKKDYTMTKYLGGSIQGDWNPAVERSTSANLVIPVEYEPENIEGIRRLAVFPGICHVRTPDGSSFAANIDVKDDREEKWTTRLSKISLDISRCDPEGYDGMTYTEWIKDQTES